MRIVPHADRRRGLPGRPSCRAGSTRGSCPALIAGPGQDALRARLARARRPRGHHRAAAGPLHRPALHGAQGALRRRARAGARRARGGVRSCRSSGSPATTTTSPRPTTPPGSAPTARCTSRRCPTGRRRRRSARCRVNRSAPGSPPRWRRSPPTWPSSRITNRSCAWLRRALPPRGHRGGGQRRPRSRSCWRRWACSASTGRTRRSRRRRRRSCAARSRTRPASKRRWWAGRGSCAPPGAIRVSSVGDGATLVMLENGQGRDRLILRERRVRDPPRGRTPHAGRAGRHAGRGRRSGFPPTCSCGPVVERAVLPTVAYVAGPGELRYLALAAAVYERLGVSPQRPGAAVVGHARRAAGGPGARQVRARRWTSCSRPATASRRGWRAEHLPAAALAAHRRAPRRHRPGVRRARGHRGRQSTRRCVRPIQGLRSRALGGVDKAEKKLVQHLKRRFDTETSQIRRARTAAPARRAPAGTGAHRGALPGALRARHPARAAARRHGRLVPRRP